ncbi:S4 domain-containing protein YaaA [Risungbinella massiliensis]|uniref:S4 domain-containing protein YaaA n=1 Tax=Risungbinella massiliensis TaxID=1329796 RepID=UPI0005CC42AF|nr:S4 domain-containing protein YaaA [Risungbinella massiliensis]
MIKVQIQTEYITLGQFLKKADLIDSGGQAKFFLEEVKILVNQETENRRGRKLYKGDQVQVVGFDSYEIV